MRVLLLDDDAGEVRGLRRELADRYDVRQAETLPEALKALAQPNWRPDVVVTALAAGDPRALEGLRELQAAAGAIPVLVRTPGGGETLRSQLDSVAAIQSSDDSAGFSLLRAMLQQQHVVQQMIEAHRGEIMREIERVARHAADSAAARAADELVDRLDLDDEEGLRSAIRLARTWDGAKQRFFAAVATGLGSAFLVALGAGIVTLLRVNASR